MREAAERLNVDPSRVRQLLRNRTLAGRRVGGRWLVASEDVGRLAGYRTVPGRPLAPARAWGLLDLLDGGAAPWLTPVARSQVRQLLRRLDGESADRWRGALGARSHVLRCQAHPTTIPRLLGQGSVDVLRAGPAQAARQGVDLMTLGEVPEVYVLPNQWPELARSLMITEGAARPNLLVRLPRGPWPFQDRHEVGLAALAADLLESAEPRSISSGVATLNDLSGQNISAQR